MVYLFNRRQMKRRSRPTGAEAGGSLVELALIFPLVMLLLFGMIDLGRWIYLDIEVSSAAAPEPSTAP